MDTELTGNNHLLPLQHHFLCVRFQHGCLQPTIMFPLSLELTVRSLLKTSETTSFMYRNYKLLTIPPRSAGWIQTARLCALNWYLIYKNIPQTSVLCINHFIFHQNKYFIQSKYFMLISKNMATFWKRIFLWNIFSSERIMIMYTTNQKFGFGTFLSVFERTHLRSPRLHLFNPKYTTTSNILKCIVIVTL